MAIRKKKKNTGQQESRRWIIISILIMLTLSVLMQEGWLGNLLYNFQRYLLGDLFWLVNIALIGWMILNLYLKKINWPEKKLHVMLILIAWFLLLVTTFQVSSDSEDPSSLLEYLQKTFAYFTNGPEISAGGGLLGMVLYSTVSFLFGKPGAYVFLVVFAVIFFVLLFTFEEYKKIFSRLFKRPEDPLGDEPAEAPKKKPRKRPKQAQPTEELPLVQPIMLSSETGAENEPPKKASFFGGLFGKGKGLYHDLFSTEEETTHFGDDEDKQLQEEAPRLVRHAETTASLPMIPSGEVISGGSSRLFINADETENKNANTEALERVQVPFALDAPSPKNNGKYKLPKITLLDALPQPSKNDENEIAAEEKGKLLLNILANFGIESEMLDKHIGPSVTQFEIRPDGNVKIAKITSLSDNIKMQLAARDIRIEAPIPGKNAVGIEIPNVKSVPVRMREMIASAPDDKEPLLIWLGKDLYGKPVTCRIDRTPHLLIAGATGSGKSVCMNSIITSLLFRTNPENVKMLLIDPKKVEFTPYQRVPHLIGPVISDPDKANNALKVIVRIMDDRYTVFSKTGVRNVQSYNRMVEEQEPSIDGAPPLRKMPYIVVIIDELADLMTVAGKEVESSIQRITQLARAAGIHMIIATQRPSVDVITGVIKSNIPSRIAFAVSSGVDSRTILDHQGAERLLGNGDMLYIPYGQNTPVRVQGVYVTDDEVRRIAEFCSSQATPMYDDSFVLLEGVEGNEDGAVVTVNEDPLYEEIKEFVIHCQKASTSLLQRNFSIGYNRAARMIDALETNGIIGPVNGSKPREVLVKREDANDMTETDGMY